MYHYYIQKSPPSSIEIANAKPIERVFYFASMELGLEEEKKKLESLGF